MEPSAWVSPTERPEFKAWFKNSLVVDANGAPLTVYHGTRAAFESFDRLRSTAWRSPSMDTVGVWFSSEPERAATYSGGEGHNVVPVYLSIQNPKVYPTFGQFLDEMHFAAGRDPKTQNPKGLGSAEELRAQLMAQGYDGIRFARTNVAELNTLIQEHQDAVRRAKDDEYRVDRRDRAPYTMKRERLEQSLADLRTQARPFGDSLEFDGHDVWVALSPEQIRFALSPFGPELRAEMSPLLMRNVSQEMTPNQDNSGVALAVVSPPLVPALPKEREYTPAIVECWARIGYSKFSMPVETYPWGGRSFHIAWRIVVSNYIEPEDVLRAVWVREQAMRETPDSPGKWDARDSGMSVIGDLLRERSGGRWQDEISELAAKLPSLMEYMDKEWGEETRAFAAQRRRAGIQVVSDETVGQLKGAAMDSHDQGLPVSLAKEAAEDIEATTPAAPDRNDSVVYVEPGQMAAFQKRLDSLNKKAVAFGLDPIKIVSTEDALFHWRADEPFDRDGDRLWNWLLPVPAGMKPEHPVMLKRIAIEYPVVKLGGWQVVGKLEAVEGGNLTFSATTDAGDRAELARRAEHPIDCDHCATKRRRKDGFLLRHADAGTYKEVGSTCLEDFTGIDPARALFLAKMAALVGGAEADLEEFAAAGRSNCFSTQMFMARVSFAAKRYGFISATRARESGGVPTYQEAADLEFEMRRRPDLRRDYCAEAQEHWERAGRVLAWVGAKAIETDFDRNVKLLLSADTISMDRKHLAFAAAALAMYDRAMVANALANARPSAHVGAPGEKMKAAVFVERVVPIDTGYGAAFLVLLADDKGNKLKWKTGACPDSLRRGAGQKFEVAFKVKGHDNYNGAAQTSITHLKVLNEPEAALAPAVSIYTVSAFRHAGNDMGDFSEPVHSHKSLDAQSLAAVAAELAIESLVIEGEYQCLASPEDDTGARYSLHVHHVDGHEPDAQAWEALCALLQVQPVNVRAELPACET